MSIEVASRALVGKAEAADMLGVSTQTLDRYRRRGRLSPVQIVPRGRVRYRIRDLERLLDAPPDPYPADPGELDWH
jgi:predicted site-specific integrase-resolvase